MRLTCTRMSEVVGVSLEDINMILMMCVLPSSPLHASNPGMTIACPNDHFFSKTKTCVVCASANRVLAAKRSYLSPRHTAPRASPACQVLPSPISCFLPPQMLEWVWEAIEGNRSCVELLVASQVYTCARITPLSSLSHPRHVTSLTHQRVVLRMRSSYKS